MLINVIIVVIACVILDCVKIIETIVDELQNSAANVGATGHNKWCHVLAIQDVVRNELAAERKLSSSRPH
jgi:hypothetical protein